MPVTVIGTPAPANVTFNRSRSTSPRSLSEMSASGVSTSRNAATPAAMETTLLLNVPACDRAPPCAGSNAAMIERRPPNAPNVIPPPRYLPSVVMSGTTPKRAWAPPGCKRDVITSSKISTLPCCVHSLRSASRKPGSAGMQPPDPCTGSTTTQAIAAPAAANAASIPGMSLYGTMRKSCGTFSGPTP